MAFDDIYQYVGEIGVYQIVILTFLCFVPFNAAIQVMLIVFLGPDQDHWCNIERLANFSHDEQKYIAIPVDEETNMYDRCVYFNIPYENISDEQFRNWNRSLLLENNVSLTYCDNGWIYDQSMFISTLVSKFDLVCSHSNLIPLPSLAILAGATIVTPIIGPLSDYFGRKTILLIGIVTLSPLGFIAAFVPDFKYFVVLRALTGIVVHLMLHSAFVLAVELFGPKYRAIPGTIYWFNYCLGFMTLPIIAYFIRDFQKLGIALSCIVLPLLMFTLILPESPRWLTAKGNDKEAEIVLKDMAEVNNTCLPRNMFNIIKTNKSEVNQLTKYKHKESQRKQQPFIVQLLKSKTLLKRIAILIPAWMSIGLVYFGLSLNMQTFQGNIYTVTFLSGLVELPAQLLAFPLLLKCKRKVIVIVSMLLSALVLLACIPFMGTDLALIVTVLSLIAKGLTSLAFISIETFTLELFPTVTRQFCYGIIKTMAYFGALLSPYTGLPMMNIWKPMPLVLFAATQIISSLMLLFLTDTFQRQMPDTINELKRKPSLKVQTQELDLEEETIILNVK